MAHALLANDPMVIRDARNDDRFHDNPLVTGQPGIRFHAGRPLAAPNGLTASTRDRAKSAPDLWDRQLRAQEAVAPPACARTP